MATRHVLLGLLDIAPMSGYDIRRNLSISLESLWAASYGQIYPTLHKLAADSLIRTQDQATGGRERIVYHITPEGRREFREWLDQPIECLPCVDAYATVQFG